MTVMAIKQTTVWNHPCLRKLVCDSQVECLCHLRPKYLDITNFDQQCNHHYIKWS
jgi:hypothetical protein